MKIRLRSSKLAGGLGLLLALLLVIALGVPAGADFFPGTYHQFFGSVKICDELVVTGDVTARIDGSVVEWTTPINASGNYGYTPDFLMIPKDDPETPEKDGGVDGVDTVRFYVQDRLAGEALFETDEPYWTLLDLQVTDVYLETNADPPAGGTVTGADTYTCSDDAPVQAFPAGGWVFTGWSGNLTGDVNPTTVHMDGDKSVTANFAPVGEAHDLTMAVSGNGTTEPAVGDHSYPAGEVVSITATEASGWDFVSWSTGDITEIDDPNSPSTTVYMDKTKTVTANFVVEGVIPGDADGNGVINVLDITKVARIIVGLDAETPGADANEDGVVDVLDITKIARIIVGLD